MIHAAAGTRNAFVTRWIYITGFHWYPILLVVFAFQVFLFLNSMYSLRCNREQGTTTTFVVLKVGHKTFGRLQKPYCFWGTKEVQQIRCSTICTIVYDMSSRDQCFPFFVNTKWRIYISFWMSYSYGCGNMQNIG